MSIVSSKLSISTSEKSAEEMQSSIQKRRCKKSRKKKTSLDSQPKYRTGEWDRDELISLYTIYAVVHKFNIPLNFELISTRSASQIKQRLRNTKNIKQVVRDFWKKEEDQIKFTISNSNDVSKDKSSMLINFSKIDYMELNKKMYNFLCDYDEDYLRIMYKKKSIESLDTHKNFQFTLNVDQNRDLLHQNKIFEKFKKISFEMSDGLFFSFNSILSNQQGFNSFNGYNDINLFLNFSTIMKFFSTKCETK